MEMLLNKYLKNLFCKISLRQTHKALHRELIRPQLNTREGQKSGTYLGAFMFVRSVVEKHKNTRGTKRTMAVVRGDLSWTIWQPLILWKVVQPVVVQKILLVKEVHTIKIKSHVFYEFIMQL